MAFDILSFNPASAPADGLAAWHAVRAAVWAVEFPEDPVPTYDSVVGQLRAPQPEYGPRQYWIAYHDDLPAGTVWVGLPDDQNSALAPVQVVVHPEHRRAGIGTALLRTVLGAVQD